MRCCWPGAASDCSSAELAATAIRRRKSAITSACPPPKEPQAAPHRLARSRRAPANPPQVCGLRERIDLDRFETRGRGSRHEPASRASMRRRRGLVRPDPRRSLGSAPCACLADLVQRRRRLRCEVYACSRRAIGSRPSAAGRCRRSAARVPRPAASGGGRPRPEVIRRRRAHSVQPGPKGHRPRSNAPTTGARNSRRCRRSGLDLGEACPAAHCTRGRSSSRRPSAS